ncbi:type I restriction endonuclease subunit S [Rhizobium leguminosarum]|uniref:restriction endonuclease subunit S n=1 Tax=Rhizobium TaxID=379 RepID=UPI00102F6D98|nr:MULTISPECIES: restriction endonuclease subunit S [Rhizobium]MBY5442716.1 type I restriction endonuclease subunit S [Rhizobium leguminosarum]TBA59662.1 type I restriction endonuclease subunit S [Rhizobium ruizarguesonis]
MTVQTSLEWAATIPNGWRVVPLKRVCKFTTGWTPPTGDSAAYVGDNLWANISDVGPRVIRDTAKRLSDDAVKRHSIALSPAGSLLFSFKLSVGQVSFAGEDMFTNEAIATFLPSHALDLNFAYYAFPEMIVRNATENIYGAKILNQQLINSAPLVLPPRPEQTAIAAFLDRETGKIDALVEEQRRLIELLKEKRLAVISHAVTKGLDPNARMKPSRVEWLRDVPEHWDVTRLKFVAVVQTGTAKGKDLAGQTTIKVPYLRVANVQDGYIDLSDVAEIEVPVSDLNRYLLRQGDVLMNEGGDFDKLGRGGIWDGSIDPCIHQNHVFAVRPNGVLPEWLNMVTSSAYGRFYFMSRSKQSTNLASISSTNVMELPLALPPAGEQALILDWLAGQLTRIRALEEQCNGSVSLLLERRSALISSAVTGKIDVRDVVVREVAA